MRTGKLAITRGHPNPDGLGRLRPRPEPAPPVSPDYGLVHDRLTALERLTRLFEQGALSAEEFAAEKAVILALPADELLLRDPAPVSFSPAYPRRAVKGPSLLGRILSLRFLGFSLAVGLGFSFLTQPVETARSFDQLARFLGA